MQSLFRHNTKTTDTLAFPKIRNCWEFPGGPVISKTQQSAQVQSLIGELKSYKVQGKDHPQPQQKKNEKKNFYNLRIFAL